MIRKTLEWRPSAVLLSAALLIAAIAITDWKIVFEATLGFLYMFPLVLLGTVWGWSRLTLAAAFCTFLSDRLDPFPVDMQIPRNILIFTTLITAGLLSRAVTKAYRREVESLGRAEREMLARRAAEEQLEFLIRSSAAAVLTMTADGEILLANPAAHRLFGAPEGSLPGRRITRYVAALGSVPSIAENDKIFRTQMQTRGQRESGEVFLADVFFSTYNTPAGPRLAALVIDASEPLREREEASLQQLLAGSRILVAAVSHEVRNVCGAIGVIHENLARQGALEGNQDFEALGSLVETLAKIASLELKQSTSSRPGGAGSPRVDLHDVLTDLRIVLEPWCEESGIELRWEVPEELPLVEADRHSLLQVLLNLTKNSQRALESISEKVISIAISTQRDGVSIRVSDSGPGIPAGKKLFQPLQKDADATGLGLYLSRAFVRSFRGDLRHDPNRAGCSFVIELASVPEHAEEKTPPAVMVEANPLEANVLEPGTQVTNPHAAHTIVAS
jgi:two-component system, LuxR family, sensor kinase FixL